MPPMPLCLSSSPLRETPDREGGAGGAGAGTHALDSDRASGAVEASR